MDSTLPSTDARSTTMTAGKAIAIKDDKALNLKVLTAFVLLSVIVLDVVSLLIGGVLRPLHPEW